MTKGKAIRDAARKVQRDVAEAHFQRQEHKEEEESSKSFVFYMFVACLLTWAAYSYGFTMGGQ